MQLVLKNLAYALVLLSSFVLQNSFALTPAKYPLPTIIVTDMSNDDWLSLVYMFSQPRQRIVGVIVDNNGAATCQAPHYYGAVNANNIIHLTAPSKKIPIVCASTPSSTAHAYKRC